MIKIHQLINIVFLKLLADESKDQQSKLQFFAYEMKAQRHHEKTPKHQKLLLWLYEFFSDYGRSIWRPIISFLVMIMFYWLIIYLCSLIVHYKEKNYQQIYKNNILQDNPLYPHKNTLDALSLSFTYSLPFQLGAIDKKSIYVKECLLLNQYNYEQHKCKDDNYKDIAFLPLKIIQAILGLVFLFLIGLGLRNRFLLKS